MHFFAIVILPPPIIPTISKLPELARPMGISRGEFKKAQREPELSIKDFERPIKDMRLLNLIFFRSSRHVTLDLII